MKRIYLDHAATTCLDSRVKAAMEPFWRKNFGNASSIHKEGCDARNALSLSRKAVASLISASPDEIIFTNGGTESDNLAIFGVANQYKKGRIIASKIEHHAVLNPCEELEKQGFDVTYLNVDRSGIVDLRELKNSLRKDTILISIMYANNEIGAIQPIREIAKIIREFRKQNPNPAFFPFFHTDAVQAAGYLDLNVQRLGVDLMSVNASKIYGPKGIGFLYVRRGVKISPLIFGGGQERGLRPGTENVAGIAGLSKALEISREEQPKESKRLVVLRDYLAGNILEKIPGSVLNGHPTLRLPNNVNVTISSVEGESLVLYLDAQGIACSTGSACTSSSLEPSHVITALGKSEEDAHCSVRFTLGRETQRKDIDYLLEILPEIVEKLRKVSAIT
ncbi:MAG: Cysteine desulfurase [Candidatus Giovannonibacteria bacterium GW2011_GWA2_44_26]|uniref:Cysteine desulfurase n=1 Tax=Candidatus Giovannonibacteria bacterium GW2011_GWA2_44_26 TaxID=1618648 RepID=A0A0G1IRQ0_9BACT|nr:MAG: Cysteine desulfurase [Candidatus Giovannonibacteria bacterium GW2011_GWA2_44_26]